MRCITIQILIYPCTSHIDNFHFRTWILQVLSSTVLLAHFYYILLPAKSKKNAHTKKVIFLGFHVEKIKKPLWVSRLIINWFWDRISCYLIGSNKHYETRFEALEDGRLIFVPFLLWLHVFVRWILYQVSLLHIEVLGMQCTSMSVYKEIIKFRDLLDTF